MTGLLNDRAEWLEADGLGGFASGTATGIRTRRYHALLLSALTPPTNRQVLVAGLDAELETAHGSVALSSQRYTPDVIHPDGHSRIASFETDPWPRWTYRISDVLRIEHAVFVPKGLPVTVLRWRRINDPPSTGPLRLVVRPFIAGRDHHSTHHENGAFRFEPEVGPGVVRWTPYAGLPTISSYTNGTYAHHPDWYRNFDYAEERARGLDATEDLACPGSFEWDLADGALLVLAMDTDETRRRFQSKSVVEIVDALTESERHRRAAFRGPLERAADAYLVKRGDGLTLVAGYPWFTDWGRDTFIAIRGLCLATERYDDALRVLLAWAGSISEGMLPNRFPDAGEVPEFNAVDASLWFVIAAHELLEAQPSISAAHREALQRAIDAIVDGYSRGTRFGIRADSDGLLAAGVPGVQLTWMDARVGDRVITPRVGKPVEIQALWINALWIASHFLDRWKEPFGRAFAAFETRFWNESDGALYDVIDVDHVAGAVDSALRPNQILAAGGLPLCLVEGDRARRLVDHVEARLVTPIGLRTLAPGAPGYCGHYGGSPSERDAAYHQGTVWPWLLGPFVEAWVRTRGGTAAARREARTRFLDPLLAFAVVGHLPEVASGDAPHQPGGCPFQAWSLGEALRLDRVVLNRTVPASAPVAASADC